MTVFSACKVLTGMEPEARRIVAVSHGAVIKYHRLGGLKTETLHS